MAAAFNFTITLAYAAIFAVLVGLGALVVAMRERNLGLRRAGYLCFIAGAVIAIPAFLGGECFDRAPELFAGVKAANFAFLVLEILGALSLVAFVLERVRLQALAPSAALLFVLAGVANALLIYTATLGGPARVAAAHSLPQSTRQR